MHILSIVLRNDKLLFEILEVDLVLIAFLLKIIILISIPNMFKLMGKKNYTILLYFLYLFIYLFIFCLTGPTGIY